MNKVQEKLTTDHKSKRFINEATSKNVGFKEEILTLKEQKNALILAHYYQEPEIQDLADFIGDSLELTHKITTAQSDLIIFCGVFFMAETAKIMNPEKRIVVPDLDAGCSLSESCPPDKFKAFIDKHPDHVVVTYMNCSAEIKALSDIVCTSSSALKIINSIPKEQPIIFAPDVNLGKYLIRETGREMLLWDGSCVVHEAFNIEKLLNLHLKYPRAKIIAHPESEPHILKVADFIGSTSKLIDYINKSAASEFIIATEAGILHEISRRAPHKTVIPAPVHDENSCSCSECFYMKMNTLQKLYSCIKNESPEVAVDEAVRKKAIVPIQRMFKINSI